MGALPGQRGIAAAGARILPRGWGDLLRQLALFLACCAGYEVVRAALATQLLGPGSRAIADAARIIDLERVLHVFAEPRIETWTAGRQWLMTLADLIYLNAHGLVTAGGLAWVYFRRHPAWPALRNRFVIAMVLALIGYAIYPTAPPRLMPGWGFTDPVRQFTGIQVERGAGGALLNLYAAVPSMHVCFAVMLGLPLSRLVHRRPARIAWALYPVVIAFVVVATGNHYLADVVLGAVTAGFAGVLAQRLPRRGDPLPAPSGAA